MQLERQDPQECPIADLDGRQPPTFPPPSGSIRSDAPQGKGRNTVEERAMREDFHDETFSNATHRSATDPDARLYKKGRGQEAPGSTTSPTCHPG